MRISFTAQGHIYQTIKLLTEKYTEQQIVDMLKSGEAYTTVQEKGNVEIISTGEIIGIVTSVDNYLEYEDFEILT